MEYTEEQLKFIQSRKPEFIPKPIPSLDAVIVEFLQRYEVNIDSASFQEINIGTGVKGGLIGIQRKKAQVEEWTKWKQWALDRKDFEAFKVKKIDDIKKYNDEISKKLKDPDIQKQLEPLFEELRKKNKKEKELENKVLLFGGGLFFAAFLGLVIYAFIESQKNKESYLNDLQSNIEYYQEDIPFNEEFLDSEEFLEKIK